MRALAVVLVVLALGACVPSEWGIGPPTVGRYGAIRYQTRHGIGVVDEHRLGDRLQIEAECERTIAEWEARTPLRGIRQALAGEAYLVVEAAPFPGPCRDNACHGTATARVLRVVWQAPLTRSTLSHELGHVILYRVAHLDGEQYLTAYAARYGVPR